MVTRSMTAIKADLDRLREAEARAERGEWRLITLAAWAALAGFIALAGASATNTLMDMEAHYAALDRV